MSGKLDVKSILDSVKSMIGSTPIPEAAKENPIEYRLSELSKALKKMAELQTQQADMLAKADVMLGELYQDVMVKLGGKTEIKEKTSEEKDK